MAILRKTVSNEALKEIAKWQHVNLDLIESELNDMNYNDELDDLTLLDEQKIYL